MSIQANFKSMMVTKKNLLMLLFALLVFNHTGPPEKFRVDDLLNCTGTATFYTTWLHKPPPAPRPSAPPPRGQ